MGAVGLEPTNPKAFDFESNASTNSATLPRLGAYAAALTSGGIEALTRSMQAPTELSLSSRPA